MTSTKYIGMDVHKESMWLANCYFVHNSLRFPVLLLFFNASSRRLFHRPNRRRDPVSANCYFTDDSSVFPVL